MKRDGGDDAGVRRQLTPTKRGETLLLLWSAAAALTPKCPLCLFALLGATGAAGAASLVWMPIVMILSLLTSVAITIVVGRFVFQSTAVVYAGAAALFVAAVFNFTLERLRWHKPLAF